MVIVLTEGVFSELDWCSSLIEGCSRRALGERIPLSEDENMHRKAHGVRLICERLRHILVLAYERRIWDEHVKEHKVGPAEEACHFVLG